MCPLYMLGLGLAYLATPHTAYILFVSRDFLNIVLLFCLPRARIRKCLRSPGINWNRFRQPMWSFGLVRQIGLSCRPARLHRMRNRSLESIPVLYRLQIRSLYLVTATRFKDDIENLLYLSLCVWILQNSDWSEYGSAACQLFFILHRGRFSYIQCILIEAFLTLSLSLFNYRFFIGSRIFPQTGVFLRFSMLI